MGLGKFYTSLEISAYKQTSRVSESRARKKTLEFLNISDFKRGSLRVSDFTILYPFCGKNLRDKNVTRRFDQSTVIIKQSEVNNYISSTEYRYSRTKKWNM